MTKTDSKPEKRRLVNPLSIRVLLPIVLAAVLLFLWVDSRRAARRLFLLPGGDAALGLKSAAGWLSWCEFTPWAEEYSEREPFSVPYCALVGVCLALALRGVALRRKSHRFRWWEWMALATIVLCLAAIQGRTDPVAHLLKAIRQPPDEYALHEVFKAVDQVNRVGRGDEVAAPLIGLLDDSDSVLRVRAARALGRLHADPQLVVQALIKEHTDRKVQYFATVSLGQIGPTDDRVVPALVRLLKDPFPEVRGAAVSALQEMGPAAADAVPALIAALDDKSMRLEVTDTLAGMGPSAKAAAPALIELLKTASGYDRLNAAQALWKIDENIDVVVPALIQALSDPYLPVRSEAAAALGEIGPRARDAIPALIAARDYKPMPQPKAELPEPQTRQLAVVTKMPDAEYYPRVRDAAIRALSRIEGKK
jgi:HEAT repeat protein